MRIDQRKTKVEIEKEFNKIKSDAKFIIKNNSDKINFDVNTATLADVSNVLATVIKKLQSKGIFS